MTAAAAITHAPGPNRIIKLGKTKTDTSAIAARSRRFGDRPALFDEDRHAIGESELADSSLPRPR